MEPESQNPCSQYPPVDPILDRISHPISVNSFPILSSYTCSWLRHCATSRKVAVSIPDGVIGIFYPSGRTLALGSASNRNEYQEYYLGCNCGWCVGLTTLQPSCRICLENWQPQPPGTRRVCNGPAKVLLYLYLYHEYYLHGSSLSQGHCIY
jgi:hypothetical protein